MPTPAPRSALLTTLPLLLLPPLFWAGNFVVGRAIRHDIPPFTLAFGRWTIALLVLLPFAWRLMRRDWPLYRQHTLKIVAVSLAGVAAFNTLIYAGLHHTSTTNALLLNSCIPVLIMLFGACFYRQPLLRLQILGLLLSLGGAMTIVLGGQAAGGLSLNTGDILVFTAMICWAFYTLWMKTLPPAIDRIGLMALQICIALPALLPFWLWERAQGAQIEWSAQAAWALAYVGILPSVAAYLLYTFAVASVGALRAGLSVHLIPVFGVLMSVWFLGETLNSHHLAGIAAVAAGLLLCNRTPR